MAKKQTANKKTVATAPKKAFAMGDLEALIVSLSRSVSALMKDVKALKEEPTEPKKVTRSSEREYSTQKTTERQSASRPTKTAALANEIKCRYELWAYDEYNQGSIVNAGPRLDKIIEAAKRYVTEQNVDNALCAAEKDKSWEAYFPQVFVNGEPTNDVLYAGNKRDGKHYVYVKGDSKWEIRKPDATVQFQFYLGETSNGRAKSDWFHANHKGKLTTSLSDINLERKTVLFVKVL